MDTLDHKSDEFKRILEYVANTHAATHSNYKLIVEDVFKVRRDGEDKRYEAFKKLHNRKLLWHGSRLTNFAGILSQGLIKFTHFFSCPIFKILKYTFFWIYFNFLKLNIF
jgi:poly [ADP-ribose] polymerase